MSVLAFAAVVGASMLTVALLVLAVGNYRLVARLRRDHPAPWQSLGSPSPWFTKLEDLSVVNRFLARRMYEGTADPELISLAERLRLLTRIVYGLGVTLVLLAAARLTL